MEPRKGELENAPSGAFFYAFFADRKYLPPWGRSWQVGCFGKERATGWKFHFIFHRNRAWRFAGGPGRDLFHRAFSGSLSPVSKKAEMQGGGAGGHGGLAAL